MKVLLVIFLTIFFSACGDSDTQTQQSEVKTQNDTLDSSKTIKPNSSNIIDKNEDSNATNNINIDSNVTNAPSIKTQDSTPKQIDVKTLYAKCAVCHGVKGDKIAPGSEGNVLISKLSKETIISDLKGYRAKTLKKGKSSAIMYLQTANLSDADIESLGEYIASFSK